MTVRRPRFAVVVFPGSNCDRDCWWAVSEVCGADCEYVWHHETDLTRFDCVILPGGFSYGDYLRVGAVARFSPVMDAVVKYAEAGGLVLGICNGFQILLEAGLLPGAMQKNDRLAFRCHWTTLRVESNDTPFSNACSPGQVLRIPIAHYEGNYYADASVLSGLETRGQVVFRYADPDGTVTPAANPNGSVNNIAGITNAGGNVLGMMPHPERASEACLGSVDGRLVFESILTWLADRGSGEEAAARG